jgi:hypothetical protein
MYAGRVRHCSGGLHVCRLTKKQGNPEIYTKVNTVDLFGGEKQIYLYAKAGCRRRRLVVNIQKYIGRNERVNAYHMQPRENHGVVVVVVAVGG